MCITRTEHLLSRRYMPKIVSTISILTSLGSTPHIAPGWKEPQVLSLVLMALWKLPSGLFLATFNPPTIYLCKLDNTSSSGHSTGLSVDGYYQKFS